MCRSTTPNTRARRCPSHSAAARREKRRLAREQAQAAFSPGVLAPSPTIRAQAVSEALTVPEIEHLSRDRSPLVRAKVASICRSEKQIRRAIADRVDLVRSAVTENPRLAPEQLRRMATDPSPTTRRAVRNAMRRAPELYGAELTRTEEEWDADAISLEHGDWVAYQEGFDAYLLVGRAA